MRNEAKAKNAARQLLRPDHQSRGNTA